MKLMPVVLVEIDANSRLHILQDAGVRVAIVDRRIDPHLVLLPERNQPIEINDRVSDLTVLSIVSDDPARTAAEMLRRLVAGDILVAASPVHPAKESA